MQILIKQFVPSHVCLKCDGCCRYQMPDSMWRPKWDKNEFVDDNDFVTTIQECGQHLCRFLNKSDNTCRVYEERPFECALYPFILSKQGQEILVYVHLACPYIQDQQASVELIQFKDYLKALFQSPHMVEFLKKQQYLLHDYTKALDELQYVFTIQTTL